MQALVLAAGEGKRLAGSSERVPKPLLRMNGQPLLAHTLSRLEQAGLDHAFVVIGFQAEKIEDFLETMESSLSITTIRNEAYHRENGFSLKCADVFLHDRFLLAMGDHIVDPEIYRAAIRAKKLGLCVDFTPTLRCQTNDATRLFVDKTKIIQIGKELQEWNAIDTGVFSLTRDIFEVLEELEKKETEVTITQAIRSLIREDKTVEALDVSGKFWADVDTPEDLHEVEAILQSPSTLSEP
jgi:choline kinase